MEDRSLPNKNSRIGFHYFSDAIHYRESDFIKWLPELKSLGASWVTLYTPLDRAIPEPFISGLIRENINPILHFRPSTSATADSYQLKTILNAYAHWGVQYTIFFDRPNQLSSWSPADWAQDKLVERFVDILIPYAEAALTAGLTPVLPPFEPGGNYWDTAFLRDTFTALNRRGYASLFDQMIMSAYAKLGNRPVNWGAGGPERWPSAKPYHTPKGSEDQRGFRIFDWYLATSMASIGKALPIILLGVGGQPGDKSDPNFPPVTKDAHTERHMEIVQALAGEASKTETIPAEVIACNFWPLCATPDKSEASFAWIQEDGSTFAVVEAMRNWVIFKTALKTKNAPIGPGKFSPHPIAHYLLITEELWTNQAKHSPFLQAFLEKYKPTIGFQVAEAGFANRVTIYGDTSSIPDSVVDLLAAAGCQVERIQEDGTLIAPNPAEA